MVFTCQYVFTAAMFKKLQKKIINVQDEKIIKFIEPGMLLFAPNSIMYKKIVDLVISIPCSFCYQYTAHIVDLKKRITRNLNFGTI